MKNAAVVMNIDDYELLVRCVSLAVETVENDTNVAPFAKAVTLENLKNLRMKMTQVTTAQLDEELPESSTICS